MAADAAALVKEVFALVERRRALKHAVGRVALVTAGLCVLLLEERVEPEAVQAVPLFNRGRGAPVAPGAGGAAERLRVVNLEQLARRVADKGACERVWTAHLAAPERHHVRGANRDGRADAEVTRLATVNHHVALVVDLLHPEVEVL